MIRHSIETSHRLTQFSQFTSSADWVKYREQEIKAVHKAVKEAQTKVLFNRGKRLRFFAPELLEALKALLINPEGKTMAHNLITKIEGR